jgi:hypothetical protein
MSPQGVIIFAAIYLLLHTRSFSLFYLLNAKQDSVYVLAHALKEMMINETITEAPKDCDDSGVFWETGKKLFHYLKSRNINGKTGRVVNYQ